MEATCALETSVNCYETTNISTVLYIIVPSFVKRSAMWFELQRSAPPLPTHTHTHTHTYTHTHTHTQNSSLSALENPVALLRANTPGATAACVRHFQKVRIYKFF